MIEIALLSFYYRLAVQAVSYLGFQPSPFAIWLFFIAVGVMILLGVGVVHAVIRVKRPPPLPAQSADDDREAA